MAMTRYTPTNVHTHAHLYRHEYTTIHVYHPKLRGSPNRAVSAQYVEFYAQWQRVYERMLDLS